MPTPLNLVSTEDVNVAAPLVSPTLVVEPLNIVAPAVPVPTLVDGRPQ